MKIFSTRERIILASNSPRRRQYLKDLGLNFTVCSVSIDETPSSGEDGGEFVVRMAREKAAAASREHRNSWIIAGDTAVCLDDRILGKPVDQEEAVSMLMSLSGREHTVQTGLCLMHAGKNLTRYCSVNAKVLFAGFDISTARAYAGTGEWTDKAGAYGIQGKGAFLVRAVKGSYTNVVGLPLYELVEMLQSQKVIESCS